MNYTELRKINVNEHVEKKNNLSYLSWAWAVDMLFQNDQTATWEYQFFDGRPYCQIGDTCMVFCTVRAFGKERTAQLPVMDYKNKAIPNPDAFAVNTAMQRCLAKAISLHGIGLYIYAGEDLPPDVGKAAAEAIASADIRPTAGAFEALDADMQTLVQDLATEAGGMLNKADVEGAYERIEEAGLDNEAKMGLWSLLDSKQRSALKKEAERRKNA